ncbi:8422_t:CDS:1, partial [Entrophospora sp. SA101]
MLSIDGSKKSLLIIPCREALLRVNPKVLINNVGQTKCEKRLLECPWQMELYRMINSCLPDEMHLLTDVGHMYKMNGLLDFYIAKMEWEIELLINGIKMKEHHQHFQED